MLKMQMFNTPKPAWVTSHPNFGNFIDVSIPPFANRNRPSDIKGLGTKFDQEFTNILKECFYTNDFSKLPEYKYLYDKGYRTVSGQVTIKATNIRNSRPDILLFVTKVENGRRVIDYKDMIYVECKIRETSHWTDLQVEVLDKLEKNLIALTDLEFEVAFNSADNLFKKGDKISIWEVHQASLDETNGSLITKKIF